MPPPNGLKVLHGLHGANDRIINQLLNYAGVRGVPIDMANSHHYASLLHCSRNPLARFKRGCHRFLKQQMLTPRSEKNGGLLMLVIERSNNHGIE
jgi:hypothetical protein